MLQPLSGGALSWHYKTQLRDSSTRLLLLKNGGDFGQRFVLHNACSHEWVNLIKECIPPSQAILPVVRWLSWHGPAIIDPRRSLSCFGLTWCGQEFLLSDRCCAIEIFSVCALSDESNALRRSPGSLVGCGTHPSGAAESTHEGSLNTSCGHDRCETLESMSRMRRAGEVDAPTADAVGRAPGDDFVTFQCGEADGLIEKLIN